MNATTNYYEDVVFTDENILKILAAGGFGLTILSEVLACSKCKSSGIVTGLIRLCKKMFKNKDEKETTKNKTPREMLGVV